jgi:hypothetical protein
MKIRRYRELRDLLTLKERYDYLRLGGQVGRSTFGYDRYVNQMLYRSREWKRIRDLVIVRDGGCDLGIEGFDLHSGVLVHHMNPITLEQIEDGDSVIFDPEYLICCSHNTHNAIHFGDESRLPQLPIERRPNDTIPWRMVTTD